MTIMLIDVHYPISQPLFTIIQHVSTWYNTTDMVLRIIWGSGCEQHVRALLNDLITHFPLFSGECHSREVKEL